MIVWGGASSVVGVTGGRCNQGTDSWAATTTTTAPAGRELHTAIWTGNEMIIWGGTFSDGGGNHYLNTGGRYCAQRPPTPTPSSTPTSTPTPRASPTATPTATPTPTPSSTPTTL